jgi:hypothetical protein
MPSPSHIAPEMTVRQVATAWPACAEVLEGYPGARWDGRWSLQELTAFARSREIGEGAFVQLLSAAAGVPVGRPGPSPRAASPMPMLLAALAVCLTLGAGWGVTLLLRIASGADYGAVSGASVHVHGVAQLWGWMALFIFGVGTHLLRQNTTRPAPPWLERTAAGLILAALLTFFAGLSGPLRAAVPRVDVVASCFLAAAAVLLGVSVMWTLAGAGPGQRRHGVVALVGWLWAWAGADLWFRLHCAAAPVLPDSARALLIVLPVLGLGTNAVFGFGIRLIPGLLNLRRLRPRHLSAALILYNTGLCLFLLPRPAAVRATGAGLMLAGAILYLIGMGGLRSKPSRPIYGIDPRGHVLIRAAFFWLVCGLAMILAQQFLPGLPHAYAGAWRHALTVGFITTMIMGVGYRILPIFIKQPLASTRLMLVSATLIIAGNAGRVALELATTGGWPWAYRWMGLTGLLELTALAMFAANVAMTLRNRRRTYCGSQPLTPGVRVREAVNARPELQGRLCEAGITMFDAAPFIAPSMTFGALALAVGRRPWDLLAELDGAANTKAIEPAPRGGFAKSGDN